MNRLRFVRIPLFALAVVAAIALPSAQNRSEIALRAAIETETLKGDLKSAMAQYQKLSTDPDRAVAAQALLRLAGCYEKLGQADAQKVYARIVEQFGDQPAVIAEARRRTGPASGASADGFSTTLLASKRDDRVFGPTVSRDGRYIAFTVGQRLEILDLVTGEDRRLRRTTAAPNPAQPLISPDGKLVAYHIGGTIRIIGADGTGDRELVPAREAGSGPAATAHDWLPDGRQLIVAFNGPAPGRGGRGGRGAGLPQTRPSELRLISTLDGSSTRTFQLQRELDGARLSPDAQWILATGFGGASVVAMGSGVETTVLGPEPGGGSAVWGPGGNSILIRRLRRANLDEPDLWSLRVENGRADGEPKFEIKAVGRFVAPTNVGFLYRQANSTRDAYTVDIDPSTGMMVGRPKQLTFSDDIRGPSWAPDGRRFAFFEVNGVPAPSRLAVGDVSTPGNQMVFVNEKTGLQSQPRPELAPQWFPDGKSMLVFYFNGTLGRAEHESRKFTPLLPGVRIPIDLNPRYATTARLSHDGRFLYYFVADETPSTKRRIARLDMASGVSIDVATVDARLVSGLAVSTDDTQLGFIAVTGSSENLMGRAVMIVPASGGEPRIVHRTSEVAIDHLVWSRDDKRLFYTSRVNRHLPDKVIDIGGDIWTVRVDGSDAKPLGIGLSDEYYLNIHPNGRQLIWMEENYRNELWLMKVPKTVGK